MPDSQIQSVHSYEVPALDPSNVRNTCPSFNYSGGGIVISTFVCEWARNFSRSSSLSLASRIAIAACRGHSILFSLTMITSLITGGHLYACPYLRRILMFQLQAQSQTLNRACEINEPNLIMRRSR